MEKPEIRQIKIILSDTTEITVGKYDFIQHVRREYLKHLKPEDVDRDEMYRLMGFAECVLESIRDEEL